MGYLNDVIYLKEITTYLWMPSSGGLGMRVNVEL